MLPLHTARVPFCDTSPRRSSLRSTVPSFLYVPNWRGPRCSAHHLSRRKDPLQSSHLQTIGQNSVLDQERPSRNLPIAIICMWRPFRARTSGADSTIAVPCGSAGMESVRLTSTSCFSGAESLRLIAMPCFSSSNVFLSPSLYSGVDIWGATVSGRRREKVKATQAHTTSCETRRRIG